MFVVHNNRPQFENYLDSPFLRVPSQRSCRFLNTQLNSGCLSSGLRDRRAEVFHAGEGGEAGGECLHPQGGVRVWAHALHRQVRHRGGEAAGQQAARLRAVTPDGQGGMCSSMVDLVTKEKVVTGEISLGTLEDSIATANRDWDTSSTSANLSSRKKQSNVALVSDISLWLLAF